MDIDHENICLKIVKHKTNGTFAIIAEGFESAESAQDFIVGMAEISGVSDMEYVEPVKH